MPGHYFKAVNHFYELNYHICNNLKCNNHEEYTNQPLFADLTERQREIVRAIAAENLATNVTSSEFVRKYHLKSASSVQSALKGPQTKELWEEAAKRML